MGRPKKQKDPYEGLSTDWRASVEGGKSEDINTKLAEAALEFRQIEQDKAADPDYTQARERVKIAGEPYKLRSKIVKLKCKFAKNVLESRGKA